MCGGVKYTDKTGKEWAIYFPSPEAALPVLKRDGDVEWVTWGKRKEEPDRFFALGGWARLDSINEGKWKRFHPKPVLIPVQSYMEKDHEKKSHWFNVLPEQVIQGLLAHHDDEARVYVVTIDTPVEYQWIHDRWPRLVNLSINPESIIND
jgi:putative SOS response-associated peptidase YedK